MTLPPLTAHRSPLTAHRSPLTAHRSPLTAHPSPVTPIAHPHGAPPIAGRPRAGVRPRVCQPQQGSDARPGHHPQPQDRHRNQDQGHRGVGHALFGRGRVDRGGLMDLILCRPSASHLRSRLLYSYIERITSNYPISTMVAFTVARQAAKAGQVSAARQSTSARPMAFSAPRSTFSQSVAARVSSIKVRIRVERPMVDRSRPHCAQTERISPEWVPERISPEEGRVGRRRPSGSKKAPSMDNRWAMRAVAIAIAIDLDERWCLAWVVQKRRTSRGYWILRTPIRTDAARRSPPPRHIITTGRCRRTDRARRRRRDRDRSSNESHPARSRILTSTAHHGETRSSEDLRNLSARRVDHGQEVGRRPLQG